MSGVCWAQLNQLSHTVRGTKFHRVQFKAARPKMPETLFTHFATLISHTLLLLCLLSELGLY